MDRTYNSEEILVANQYSKEKEYWSQKLSNAGKTVLLYNYSVIEEQKLENLNFQIKEANASELLRICKNSDTKLHICLIANLLLLLKKYTLKNKLSIGTTIDKQEHNTLLNTILPLYFDINDNLSFRDLILNVSEVVNEAIENQNFPISTLLNQLNANNDSDDSLFDIAITLENIQSINYLKNHIYKLHFSFKRTENNISCNLYYDVNNYPKVYINKLKNDFTLLLDNALSDTNKEISKIFALTTKEVQEIIDYGTQYNQEYPLNTSLTGLFKEVVKENEDKIAISCKNSFITFKNLDLKSDKLAASICNRIKPGLIVIILLERSIDFVIAMLAVQKAGCAFLPIDLNTPAKRLKYIIEDSNAHLIVSQKNIVDKFLTELKTLPRNLFIEIDEPGVWINYELKLPTVSGDSLAYVIYTSGSTGKPKGVLITHSNVINQIYGLNEAVFCNYGNNSLYGLVSPFIFDASMQLCYGGLLFGRSLKIISDDERLEGRSLLKSFERYKINISDGTPIHLILMLKSGYLNSAKLNLKHMIIGGDTLHKSSVKAFYSQVKNTGTRITNVYGPTECSINSLYYHIDPKILNELEIIPIGRPFFNYQIMILNEKGCICPIGVVGEICISGKGVFKGYLNDPFTTSEKMIVENQLIKDEIYRTGDLGILHYDGNIQFIGRKDNQVKIRGYRIELGEIDAVIRRHELINNSITVLFEEENKKELVSYYSSNQQISSVTLREYLKKNLPNYMIPSHLILLKEIPLLQNGKINIKSLSHPSVALKMEKIDLPSTELEQRILKIWQKQLQLDQISVNENFFNIGGDSIKLIPLLYEINEQFGIELKIADLYLHDTITKISDFIQKMECESSENQKEALEEELLNLKKNILSNLD